jgi:hypothetical protein
MPRLQALKSDNLIRFEDDVVEMRDDARFLVRTVAEAFALFEPQPIASFQARFGNRLRFPALPVRPRRACLQSPRASKLRD